MRQKKKRMVFHPHLESSPFSHGTRRTPQRDFRIHIQDRLSTPVRRYKSPRLNLSETRIISRHFYDKVNETIFQYAKITITLQTEGEKYTK